MSLPRIPVKVVQALIAILLCVLPGIIIGRVVQGYSTIWVGALAASLGAICGLVVASRPAPTQRPALTNIVNTLIIGSVGVLLAILVAAVKPGFRNNGSLSNSVVDALLRGWAELATSPLPAFAEPRTLVPVAVVSYLAAAVSLYCVRKGIGPLIVLVAPACAFLLAAVAAGQYPFGAVSSSLMFVMLSGLILAIHRRLDVSRDSSGNRTPNAAHGNQALRRSRQKPVVKQMTMAGLAVLTLGGALILGPVLTFGRDQEPFDPRDHVTPPILPANAINPLELVASRRQAGELPLFTVRASETLYPQDLHLVALNNFDGAAWSTTARYKRGGAVLDSVSRQVIATSAFDAEVTLADLDGPWLPSLGDPSSVVGVQVIVDPLSGSLVTSQPLGKGVTYRLKSRRPEPRVEQLILLPVGSSQEALDSLIVPAGMPPLLTEMARTAIGDAQLPFQRAVELRNYLRSSFTLNNSAPGGFSYGHLERAFAKDGAATDEQFAAMFATLGRVVGLPTRVVVGFSPPAASSQGEIIVRGSDSRVWAEVLFEDAGWMPFIATPSEDGRASSSIGFGGQDQVELREADPATPTPAPAPVLQATNPVPTVPEKTQRNIAAIVIPVLAVLTLIAVGLAAIALIKRRKTAQRRAGTPRAAVIGAWHDVLDRLVEAGMISGTSVMTVEEVVHATEATSVALAGLYRPVNRALYSTAELTDADRDQAWRARDRFVTGLIRRQSIRQRIWQAVNPRPLFTSTDPTSLTPLRTRSVSPSIDQPIGAPS
jgi:Transglutaminase-like superfamily/TgpA N-terminal domain